MRPKTLKPGDHVAHAVGDMLSRPSDYTMNDNHIMSLAVCLLCGQSWRLPLAEDGQYTNVHRCPGHRRGAPKCVARIAIERIGRTREDRDSLALTWRNAQNRRRSIGY